MTDLTLSQSHILAGVWEGLLSRPGGGGDADDGAGLPRIAVLHEGTTLDGVAVTATGAGDWRIRVPVPTTAISDGLQTFVVTDAQTGAKIGSFALLAGEALAHDLRAEIDLLRAELDMLKRSFRRHCLETAP